MTLITSYFLKKAKAPPPQSLQGNRPATVVALTGSRSFVCGSLTVFMLLFYSVHSLRTETDQFLLPIIRQILTVFSLVWP